MTVPNPSQFAELAEYYSTTFHELSHSTLTASRCNRKPSQGIAFSARRTTLAKNLWPKSLPPCSATVQTLTRQRLSAIRWPISKVGAKLSKMTLPRLCGRHREPRKRPDISLTRRAPNKSLREGPAPSRFFLPPRRGNCGDERCPTGRPLAVCLYRGLDAA